MVGVEAFEVFSVFTGKGGRNRIFLENYIEKSFRNAASSELQQIIRIKFLPTFLRNNFLKFRFGIFPFRHEPFLSLFPSNNLPQISANNVEICQIVIEALEAADVDIILKRDFAYLELAETR